MHKEGPYFVPLTILITHALIKTQARWRTKLSNSWDKTIENIPVPSNYVATQGMIGHKLGEFSLPKKFFYLHCIVEIL